MALVLSQVIRSLLESRGTGKSQLVKISYNAASKILFFNCKKKKKKKKNPRLLLLGVTGKLAEHIHGKSIHSVWGIKAKAKLSGLRNKGKASLK